MGHNGFLNQVESVSHISKYLANKRSDTKSVSFFLSHQDEIYSLYTKLSDKYPLKVPSELALASAKVKVAFEECLKFFEYEYIPNKGDIQTFTDDEITDEDFEYAHLFDDIYVSLDDIVTNDVGERDPLVETMDGGAYEKQEMDDAIYESLYLLTKEDREILIYRFGLAYQDELDIIALAKKYKTSPKEMEKRVNKALINMRAVLSTMIGE